VYPLTWLTNRFSEPVSLRWQHIMAWGGLRGALSLALALSLPESIGPERSLLLGMAFGVVLFTLLVQGTTMGSIIHHLKIIVRSPAQIEFEMRQAELTASRASEAHMERRFREGLISAHAWEKLKPMLQEQSSNLAKAVRNLLTSEPKLEEEELELAKREILRAKRGTFYGLRRDGVISDEVLSRLSANVDAEIVESRDSMAQLRPSSDSLADENLEEEMKKVKMEELVVEPGSPVEGNRVRYVAWPDNFVIAGIKRGDNTIVPSGDTVIRAGDVLITMADYKAFQKAQGLCQAGYPV
jgi:NhaP-type Na+/H+ and K+/H+ antiporter